MSLRLPEDVRANRAWALVGIAALGLVVALAFRWMGVIGLLLTLPLPAYFIARLLVQGGADTLTWMSREPLGAVRPDDVRIVPGTKLKALDPAGLEHLLGKRNEHEAIRFMNWMRREVVKPWEKKKAD